jgi:hypothetical protein
MSNFKTGKQNQALKIAEELYQQYKQIDYPDTIPHAYGITPSEYRKLATRKK